MMRPAAKRTRARAAVLVPARLGLVGPVFRCEVERRRVDAVAHARRVGTVREEMSEMRAAAGAFDLDPAHAEGPVLFRRDAPFFRDVVEARPSRARLELRTGVEERLLAH